jgi:hypothetical protein
VVLRVTKLVIFSRESRPEEQPEHTTAKSFEKAATSPETRTSEGELKMPHGRIIQPSACFFKKGAAAGHAVDRESSRASRHQPILTHRYSSHLLAVAPIRPSAKEGLLKGIGRPRGEEDKEEGEQGEEEGPGQGKGHFKEVL